MSDFGHSAWAVQKRMEKAIALRAVLLAERVPASLVLSLPPGSRRRIERAAGVRKCSDDTWGKAAELMEAAEQG